MAEIQRFFLRILMVLLLPIKFFRRNKNTFLHFNLYFDKRAIEIDALSLLLSLT